MFAAFMLSGAVDLLGKQFQLPDGTEQTFLSLAFWSEALLLAFHLKGTRFEVTAHLLLVFTAALCAVVPLLELAVPKSILVSMGRAYAVLLQGTWFCQIGRTLFLGNPAWADSNETAYMGASMFLPVLFVLHMLLCAFGLLLLYCLVAYSLARRGGAARGFELVERANEAAAPKTALRDVLLKPGDARYSAVASH